MELKEAHLIAMIYIAIYESGLYVAVARSFSRSQPSPMISSHFLLPQLFLPIHTNYGTMEKYDTLCNFSIPYITHLSDSIQRYFTKRFVQFVISKEKICTCRFFFYIVRKGLSMLSHDSFLRESISQALTNLYNVF